MEVSLSQFVGNPMPSNGLKPEPPEHGILPSTRDQAPILQGQAVSAVSDYFAVRPVRAKAPAIKNGVGGLALAISVVRGFPEPQFKRIFPCLALLDRFCLTFTNASLPVTGAGVARGGLAQIRHASNRAMMHIAFTSPYPGTPTTGEKTVQWEYKLITETMNADQLNEFGADGWELVMVVSPAHFVFHYFFKRELQP